MCLTEKLGVRDLLMQCKTGIFFSYSAALITSHSFHPEPEAIWEQDVYLSVPHRCLIVLVQRFPA